MKSENYNKYDIFFEDNATAEQDDFARLLSTKKIAERKNYRIQFFSTLSYLLFPLTKDNKKPTSGNGSGSKRKKATPSFISFAQMPRFLKEKLEVEKSEV